MCSSGRSSASAQRIALSTAFQEGDVALIDMAYAIDPSVRVFTVDTGRLPQETFELIEQLRERYPGLRLELLSPDAPQVQRLVDRHGPNLFRNSVEQRLLCCNVRKVQPLTRAPRRPRRLDHRAAPRPVGDPLRHPQDRDRPRPRRPSSRSTRSPTGRRRRSGTTSARTTCRCTRSTSRATRRSAARRARAPVAPGEPVARRPLVVGERTRRRSAACTARSRPAASSTSCTRSSATRRHA